MCRAAAPDSSMASRPCASSCTAGTCLSSSPRLDRLNELARATNSIVPHEEPSSSFAAGTSLRPNPHLNRLNALAGREAAKVLVAPHNNETQVDSMACRSCGTTAGGLKDNSPAPNARLQALQADIWVYGATFLRGASECDARWRSAPARPDDASSDIASDGTASFNATFLRRGMGLQDTPFRSACSSRYITMLRFAQGKANPVDGIEPRHAPAGLLGLLASCCATWQPSES